MAASLGSALVRFLTRFVLALAVAGAAVGYVVVAVHRTIDDELARIPRVDVTTVPAPEGGANYLVIGSDTRAFVDGQTDEQAFGAVAKEPGRRSDTMMVVHVEPVAGRTVVVSFPRDLWVTTPGMGNQKINAAYNSDIPGGGPDAVIDTLKSNFDLDVHHYVEVDFLTFESMVRAVGSVPVYVDRPVVDDFTGFLAVAPGCYRLNGPEALAYVRSRSPEYFDAGTGRVEADGRADLGRIERQQDFIRRLAGAVVEESLADPFKGREIVHEVVDDLRVDGGFDRRAAFDLVEAFRSVSAADSSALEFVTFPAEPGNAGGQSVLIPDRTDGEPLLARLRTFSTEPAPLPPAPSEVRVEVRNGSGRSGAADETMAALGAAGFVRGGTGNDERGRVAVTEVRYANGADAEARLLLDYLGTTAKLVNDPDLDDVDVAVVLGADFTGLVGASTGGSTPAGGSAAPPEDAAASCV
jgi:LCP family protein required for cell wall assembly